MQRAADVLHMVIQKPWHCVTFSAVNPHAQFCPPVALGRGGGGGALLQQRGEGEGGPGEGGHQMVGRRNWMPPP